MQKILIIFLSFFLISSSYANEKLQSALDKAREKNKVSAMQMTIIRDNQDPITIVSGKTMKTKDAPLITEDTLFQIGSDTKSFTATLIFKLESESKLNVSDKLSKYFPQYKQWGNVTISQLLHNNSGIPSYTKNKKFQKEIKKHPEYEWTPAELIAVA